MNGVSGTAIKASCQRVYQYYDDPRFIGLCNISPSHIYNLRETKAYQRCRRKFTSTKSIGERCKPQLGGKLGFFALIRFTEGIKMVKRVFIISMLLMKLLSGRLL